MTMDPNLCEDVDEDAVASEEEEDGGQDVGDSLLPVFPELKRGNTVLTIGEFYAPTPEVPRITPDISVDIPEEDCEECRSKEKMKMLVPEKDVNGNEGTFLPLLSGDNKNENVEMDLNNINGDVADQELPKRETLKDCDVRDTPSRTSDNISEVSMGQILPELVPADSVNPTEIKKLISKIENQTDAPGFPLNMQNMDSLLSDTETVFPNHWKGKKMSGQYGLGTRSGTTLTDYSSRSQTSMTTQDSRKNGGVVREKTIVLSTNLEFVTLEPTGKSGLSKNQETNHNIRLPSLQSPSQAPFVALQRSRTFFDASAKKNKQPASILKAPKKVKVKAFTHNEEAEMTLPKTVTFLEEADLPVTPQATHGRSIPSQRLQRSNTELSLGKEKRNNDKHHEILTNDLIYQALEGRKNKNNVTSNKSRRSQKAHRDDVQEQLLLADFLKYNHTSLHWGTGLRDRNTGYNGPLWGTGQLRGSRVVARPRCLGESRHLQKPPKPTVPWNGYMW